MLYSKRLKKLVLIILCALLCSCALTTSVAYAEEREIYLGGFAAGFILNTSTVQVVGLCDVLTDEGVVSPARNCGIRTGDIIERINDMDIDATEDLAEAMDRSYKSYEISVTRGGKSLTYNIDPVTDKASGQKRLGMLVKDSINGIGTVTYIDKTKNVIASLGHPVTDTAKNVMQINGGTIYTCAIYGVKKGVRGIPGQLKGSIENNYMIGAATKNSSCGIFGDVSSEIDTSKLQKIKTANIGEVKMGQAVIYSTVSENAVKEYDISIVKIDAFNKDNRNFVIKIDDDELIELSGGIVQGMSGSPIVQNGKLVGAVTHVFVNDPTRGYGIAIDKMLNSY